MANKRSLSDRELAALDSVHADLRRWFREFRRLCPLDLIVLEGKRSMKRQRYLVKHGDSRKLYSYHLFGLALDIAPASPDGDLWRWSNYYAASPFGFTAAKNLGLPIVWGGHWKSFPDGPHWQLEYPITDEMRAAVDPSVSSS